MLGNTKGKRVSGQQRKMAGWHHGLHGHEFEPALGDGDGQAGLVCCKHGVAQSDMT